MLPQCLLQGLMHHRAAMLLSVASGKDLGRKVPALPAGAASVLIGSPIHTTIC